MKKDLVAVFSPTLHTLKIAKEMVSILGADLYVIEPVYPYTKDDLDYNKSNSRSSIEMEETKCRPKIIKKDLDTSIYNRLFIGYPIWWYTAPRIVNTFLESYDFSKMIIIPFATSQSSEIGESSKDIKESVPKGTKVMKGKRFSPIASRKDLEDWLKTL